VRNYIVPDEARKVPSDMGGVYSFTLRFPSDYELGIKSPDISCHQIAANIQRTLSVFDEVLNSEKLVGYVRNFIWGFERGN